MTRKHERETRVALALEATAIMLALAWATQLLENPDAVVPASRQRGVHMLLRALAMLLVGVSAATLVAPQRLPAQFHNTFRQERDMGLVVGCTLVPLVLLSRLAAQLYMSGEFSGFTFLYAWTSATIGLSAFVRLVLLRASSLRVALAVDLVLLPAVEYTAGPVEGRPGVAIAAACRCLFSLVFTFGVRALPRSFTLGEAMLVAQGVAMNSLDLALYSERQLRLLGLTGSLLVCLSLVPLLRSHGSASPSVVASPLGAPQCASFAIRSLGVVGAIVYPWSCLVLETLNPFAWLLSFVLTVKTRAYLIAYWIACLVVLVPLFALAVDRFSIRTIVARKLFHALVVLMFVPAYFVDAPMLLLSHGVALAVFCLAECVRALSLPPFGEHIAAFMKAFIDNRDAGRIVLTHSYLLLGCALPLWLSPSSSSLESSSSSRSSALSANAGILALGIGDAMGAVVGSSYGRRRLIGSKTLEGTLAVLVSIVVASLFFHDFHIELFVHGRFMHLVLFVIGAALTSILEMCTSQIDNLVLPLYFFSTCNLVSCYHGV